MFGSHSGAETCSGGGEYGSVDVSAGERERAVGDSGARRWRGAGALAAVAAVVVVAGAATLSTQAPRQEVAASLASSEASASLEQVMSNATHQRSCQLDGSVCMTVENQYERALSRALTNGRYPGLLVELHQHTTVEAHGAGSECEWTVPDGVGATVVKTNGCVLSLVHTRVGSYSLRVHGSWSTHASWHGKGATTSFEVTAKYVRRELRDLSDDDRERYFEALRTIYITSDKDGADAYGPRFRSISWLVREHLQGAADRDCDHWHDDAGFLNHHVGITMQMEQSIQSVDPRVAAHYWDYTIDSLNSEGHPDYDWTDSVIFGDEWFGPASPPNAKHTVTDGRWAYTSVMSNAWAYSGITNPFGLLRSPWNTNPVPYIGRMRSVYGVKDGNWSMPNCKEFESYLDGATSMGELMQYLNGRLHGVIHIMIGGQWTYENTLFYASGEKLSAYVKSQMSSFLLASKFMWRQGFVRCPDTCSFDDADSCLCSCPTSIMEGHFSSSEEALYAAGLMPNMMNEISSLVNSGDTSWDEVLDLICHVGHAGEMFTSAAPYDPLFWPLHGMAERFIQLVRWYIQQGTYSKFTTGKFNEQWGYTHAHGVPSDTGVVCDWSGLDQVGTMSMPTCVNSTTCSGHKVDDVLPFVDVLSNVGAGDSYSNVEFYNMTAPFSNNLDYVYDQLDHFTACGYLL